MYSEAAYADFAAEAPLATDWWADFALTAQVGLVSSAVRFGQIHAIENLHRAYYLSPEFGTQPPTADPH
jgi:hypothetical protein